MAGVAEGPPVSPGAAVSPGRQHYYEAWLDYVAYEDDPVAPERLEPYDAAAARYGSAAVRKIVEPAPSEPKPWWSTARLTPLEEAAENARLRQRAELEEARQEGLRLGRRYRKALQPKAGHPGDVHRVWVLALPVPEQAPSVDAGRVTYDVHGECPHCAGECGTGRLATAEGGQVNVIWHASPMCRHFGNRRDRLRRALERLEELGGTDHPIHYFRPR